MRLLLATKNPHKTAEIAALLPGWEISDLTASPEVPAPVETGATFLENAALKAIHASRQLPGLVMADDSGLEVDALGGAPGVWSARYAGPGASDAENRARLLRELAIHGARGSQRSARFRCTLVLAERGAVLGNCEGTVEGTIVDEERGAGGFGYDALFVPAGYRQTFAELPAAVKNQLSHRGRALARALQFLETLTIKKV